MANEIAPISVKFTVDTTGLKKAESAISESGKQIKNKFSGIGKGAGIAFAAGLTAFAVRGVARFTSEAIKGAEAAAETSARIEQIAKSMGIFGTETGAVTKRLIDFADSNELVVATDADVIKGTQAKLLTFKELAATADQANGAFDRATIAAIDMASAGFGSAEQNAVQLGKALNDPIKGISALARSGVTFTEQEKAKIETLVASGQILEAQDLVLKSIETQVGGTAAATAKATDLMKLGFNQVKDSIGEALLPVVNELVYTLLPSMSTLSSSLSAEAPKIAAKLNPVLLELAEKFRTDILPAIIKLIPVIGAFLILIADNIETVFAVVSALGALSAIVKTFTMIQAALNLVLYGNPILLVVAAVALLIAGIVYLATQTTIFHDTWQRLAETFSYVKAVIADTFENAMETISGFFDTIFGFLNGLGEQLYSFGKTAWEMFVQGALDALLTLPSLVADVVGSIPGLEFLGDGINSGIGAIRDTVSSATGTTNRGQTNQPARGQVVNNYNVQARGLTVSEVTRDAKRRTNLMSPILGGV